MLRIGRLTDYATMILVHLATHPEQVCSANDVAACTRVALPTVQKILKILTRAGLVTSARGAEGGYTLARAAETISAAEILDVLEGPVAITECSETDSQCELEGMCQVGSAWQKINKAIRSALSDISLAALARPPREFPMVHMPQSHARAGGRPDRD